MLSLRAVPLPEDVKPSQLYTMKPPPPLVEEEQAISVVPPKNLVSFFYHNSLMLWSTFLRWAEAPSGSCISPPPHRDHIVQQWQSSVVEGWMYAFRMDSADDVIEVHFMIAKSSYSIFFFSHVNLFFCRSLLTPLNLLFIERGNYERNDEHTFVSITSNSITKNKPGLFLFKIFYLGL